MIWTSAQALVAVHDVNKSKTQSMRRFNRARLVMPSRHAAAPCATIQLNPQPVRRSLPDNNQDAGEEKKEESLTSAWMLELCTSGMASRIFSVKLRLLRTSAWNCAPSTSAHMSAQNSGRGAAPATLAMWKRVKTAGRQQQKCLS